ncbi:MAG: C40 family peptidase [Xanthomonadaceae bacterium]|nr:C40 family peptidase [Xanthomonadaceae bacterium]
MIHYPGPMRLTPVFPTSAHHRGALLIVLTVIAALSACGGHSNVRSSSSRSLDTHWPVVPASDPAAANAVVMRALSLVGIPYRYGGNTPESGFDCSGLINYIYQDMLDLRLPRTSRELAQIQGPKLPQKQLAAGDLVFFGNRGQVNHVGIYIGEGRFVHAPSNGGTVRLDMLDGTYWRDNYTGAKRVLY